MYSPEVRERAVRMVSEHRGEHRWEWAGTVEAGEGVCYRRASVVGSDVAEEGHMPGGAVLDPLHCGLVCCGASGDMFRRAVRRTALYGPSTLIGWRRARP